jgi:hypothetical protein
MGKDLENAVIPRSRYYPGIFLKELRKTKKNLSQNSWCPGLDSNRKPSAYE